MISHDILALTQWWAILFLLGVFFLPLSMFLFSGFFDRGYIFAKVFATIIISYTVLVLGTIHILAFTTTNIVLLTVFFLLLNYGLLFKYSRKKQLNFFQIVRNNLGIFLLEELLFFLVLAFWTYIRGHQPDIHGLEKFMDFGFVNAILRTEYFPPKDMWFTPFTINYYYFGHLQTALLTKLSLLPSSITYNLMIATIAAFTFVCSFSIGSQLFFLSSQKTHWLHTLRLLLSGILSACLVTFAGNFQILYAFFKPYTGDVAKPLWQLEFLPTTFPNAYWYPNATRFIYHTIHEFPLYSFVVSDLHGHVLSIPLVLTTVALLLAIFSQQTFPLKRRYIVTLSILLGSAYMTNAWDGIIYFGLSAGTVYVLARKHMHSWTQYVYQVAQIGMGTLLVALPFSLFFKPFVSGIGVLCAPSFLISLGKIGPLLFEADHCQHSPLWQLLILYGFFLLWLIFWGISLFRKKLTTSDLFVGILIGISFLLIITPEFIYAKDIYPAHYRANTMFKLVYQAFMLLSLCSAYAITQLLSRWKFTLLPLAAFSLTLVFLYPYFAITSYYNQLQTYRGIDGTTYLSTLYPGDYQAISWIQENVSNQPILLEAQGDSYTDFSRFSANTGLPTILGWTVHEWLWRGSYDIPAPRIDDVKTLYESTDTSVTQQLLKQYNITLVVIGPLERQKYPYLSEEKFTTLGKLLYENKQTKIYQITSSTVEK